MDLRKIEEDCKKYEELAKIIDDSEANDAIFLQKYCEETLKKLEGEESLYLYYCIENAFQKIAYTQKGKEQKETEEKVLVYFRKAIYFRKKYFIDISLISILSSIYANLSELLRSQGRYFEAIEYTEKSIEMIKNPYGYYKKGLLLVNLVSEIKEGDAIYYIVEMNKCIKKIEDFQYLLSPGDYNRIITEAWYKNIIFLREENNLDNINLNIDSYPVPKDVDSYSKWSIENKLYLNMLNDLSTVSKLAKGDSLEYPSIIYSFDEYNAFKNSLIDYANIDEINNEYCYARWILYQSTSLSLSRQHQFNKDLKQIDMGDFSYNNLKIQYLKTSFRVSYSIFDKLAYFINTFWDFGLKENKATYKNIWKIPSNEKRDFKKDYTWRDIREGNKFLTAFYYLTRDLKDYGKAEDLDNNNLSYWLNPEAEYLVDIRNAIEHKWLKVVDDYSMEYNEPNKDKDLKHVLYIGAEEMEERTLQLLKMSRYGIMYILLAMKIRAEEKNSKFPDKDRIISYETPMRKKRSNGR